MHVLGYLKPIISADTTGTEEIPFSPYGHCANSTLFYLLCQEVPLQISSFCILYPVYLSTKLSGKKSGDFTT
jgi:hypothetical protein